MENSISSQSYTFNEVNLAPCRYLMHRADVKFSDMASFFPTHIPRLAQAMNTANIPIQCGPFGLFFNWDVVASQANAAVAIPVDSGVTLDGFSTFDLPATKGISIDYYGPYSGTGDAHQAIDAYIRAKGLKASTPAIEEYVTDPAAEPDPTKRLTRITYPLMG